MATGRPKVEPEVATAVPHQTDAASCVLHALQIRGFAEASDVAVTTGLALDVVEAKLHDAAEHGWLVHREGAIHGWSLTAEGRDERTRVVATDLHAASAAPVVEAAYERFVAVNTEFKALCTAWQTEGQPQRCLAELDDVHAHVVDVTTALAQAMARFAPYGRRFDEARRRFLGGDVDALTKPLSGSYHDVWMELHQDLLLTLGRSRSAHDGW